MFFRPVRHESPRGTQYPQRIFDDFFEDKLVGNDWDAASFFFPIKSEGPRFRPALLWRRPTHDLD